MRSPWYQPTAHQSACSVTPNQLLAVAPKVIIAGAGGAAHLPGMVASLTHLPVIGVPVKSSNSIDGWDSILSILQMPNGIPVATVALNAAKNAGILAAQIISTADESIVKDLIAYKEKLKQAVEQSAKEMEG